MTLADKAYVEGIKQRAAKYRLERAAPELLEALKALTTEIKKYHPSFDARLFVQAERAIGKAEGK